MKKTILFASFVSLTACLEAGEPVVAGYNGDSVNIQNSTIVTTAPTEADFAKANAICSKGNRKAEYASTRMISEYTQEHLFLCL